VDRYDCHLLAYDGGDHARSASLHVAIVVGDVNDHSPRFDAGDLYTVTVPEDFPLAIPFLQVIHPHLQACCIRLLKRQIALMSKLKTMGLASMRRTPLFYVIVLATLCIKGLTESLANLVKTRVAVFSGSLVT